MHLGQIFPNLSGLRKGGDGYVAKCPAHDDRKASLSIAEVPGRILLKCHAGCETETIVRQLGITWKDLFDKSIKSPSFHSLGNSRDRASTKPDFGNQSVRYFSSPHAKVHQIYPYVDAEGRLQYENVRFYPKDFRPRRYDVKGKAVWNLEGVERLPYRLPDIIKAREKSQDIFLCEGEKDADAMHELGFVASSFKNWNESFNKYIEGGHVVIVQDHDQPGAVQANEAARIVLKAAASVKILDVWTDTNPDLPDKHGKDISDYIMQCVDTEGMEYDAVKERICLTIDRAESWKDPLPVKVDDYFLVQSGNDWIAKSKTQPIPEKLFGDFWFENEVCILFADTNVGKSILAVQIADAISRGGQIMKLPSSFKEGWQTDAVCPADGVVNMQPALDVGSAGPSSPPRHAKDACHPSSEQEGSLSCTVPAQKVIYFDFELTAKQFESRFSERQEGSDTFVNHYQFHPNFYRAEINPETSDMGRFEKFEDFLNASLESTIVFSGAKVIIIDNLTYLRDETENARNALPLMKYLKKLKSAHGLSILTLAHTPKRDSSKPLGRNDLQGSKMLINFCDSSFAIGESAKQPGLRYLKQIKARNTEIIYHSENVLLARVEKTVNFLKFNFLETGAEQEHLKVLNDKQRTALKDEAKRLSESGMKNKDIADKLNVTAMTIGRWLKEIQ